MKKTDAIIVLGHRLNPDNTPSDDLKRRIDKAVEVWKETGAPLIMPCGGITRDRARSEAEVMREMLLERGVPDTVIKLENQSKITSENIQNALRLLGSEARICMVTSDYHVERALDDCRHMGLNAYGVGCATPEGEYRDRCYAMERAISAAINEARAEGIPEKDIMKHIFSKMRAQAEAAGVKLGPDGPISSENRPV